MSILDARGANLSFPVVASADLNMSVTITADGETYDLTDSTLVAVVKDEDDNSIKTYAQEVVDAPNGEFIFLIPQTAFNNNEGGDLSYELHELLDGVKIPRMYGFINIWERV